MLGCGLLFLATAVTTAAPMGYLKNVPAGAPDKILGINQAFQKSDVPDKVNLVVGAYRDANGKPWVLPSVAEAEARLLQKAVNKEYAGITGLPNFLKRALAFAYGDDSPPMLEKRLAGVQTLSGTGACRLAADFYAKFLPAGTKVYCSDPTWPNHIPIFAQAGFDVCKYSYLDRATNRLDLDGMLADLKSAPDGSIIVLHACAHNPTGVDPTAADWDKISALAKDKGHHLLVDMAYQGFASGDADADALALRKLVKDGHSLLLAQSFAKNFGLYGERVGTLSVVCGDAEEAARVESQLKLIIRPMYSSPPIHGALLVDEVLSDEGLTSQYRAECSEMAERIKSMRSLLRSSIEAQGSKLDWSHVTDQIGMFAYTGMSEAMCDELMEKYGVFLTRDGRISMAGVNPSNIDKIASAIHAVTDGKSLAA